jgi:hypothetical protein
MQLLQASCQASGPSPVQYFLHTTLATVPSFYRVEDPILSSVALCGTVSEQSCPYEGVWACCTVRLEAGLAIVAFRADVSNIVWY